jgi:7-keto-8-aminopelargonate synthetase-like enzyme
VSGLVDVVVGTLGKALGTAGAYVGGSQELVEFLVSRARSFIFTTGSPPALAAATLEALRIVTILAFPAIPDTAREIWRRIGMTTDIEECRIGTDTSWGQYVAGHPVEKGDPLFPRRTIA